MSDMIKKVWAFATKDGRLSKLAEGVVFGFIFGFAGGVAAGLAREYESWRHVGKPYGKRMFSEGSGFDLVGLIFAVVGALLAKAIYLSIV